VERSRFVPAQDVDGKTGSLADHGIGGRVLESKRGAAGEDGDGIAPAIGIPDGTCRGIRLS
jgi:hypothetical protein